MKKRITKPSGISYEYLVKAAKMIKYPVDISEKLIYVPAEMLEEAENDLGVCHLRGLGFMIQSSIDEDIVIREPFNPSCNTRLIVPEIVVDLTKKQHYIGEQFKVKSTDCELEILRVEKGKIQLRYTNRNKTDLLTSAEQLDKMLRSEYWITLN